MCYSIINLLKRSLLLFFVRHVSLLTYFAHWLHSLFLVTSSPLYDLSLFCASPSPYTLFLLLLISRPHRIRISLINSLSVLLFGHLFLLEVDAICRLCTHQIQSQIPLTSNLCILNDIRQDTLNNSLRSLRKVSCKSDKNVLGIWLDSSYQVWWNRFQKRTYLWVCSDTRYGRIYCKLSIYTDTRTSSHLQ